MSALATTGGKTLDGRAEAADRWSHGWRLRFGMFCYLGMYPVALVVIIGGLFAPFVFGISVVTAACFVGALLVLFVFGAFVAGQL